MSDLANFEEQFHLIRSRFYAVIFMIIYYNNLENFYQILRWVIASLDME